ncbi:hypothetical protein CATMIT_01767, partial [Catenibacterium mitsuokai DSM 15897]
HQPRAVADPGPRRDAAGGHRLPAGRRGRADARRGDPGGAGQRQAARHHRGRGQRAQGRDREAGPGRAERGQVPGRPERAQGDRGAGQDRQHRRQLKPRAADRSRTCAGPAARRACMRVLRAQAGHRIVRSPTANPESRPMTAILYCHPDSGFSYKVALALDLLGVEYEQRQVNIRIAREQRSA